MTRTDSLTPFDHQDWWDTNGLLLRLHSLLEPVRVPRHSEPGKGRYCCTNCRGPVVLGEILGDGPNN